MARPRTVKSAARNAQIKLFRGRGWSVKRIATKYGITEARVSQVLHDEGSHIATVPVFQGRQAA